MPGGSAPGLILTHFTSPLPHHQNILRCPHAAGSRVQTAAPGKVDAADKVPCPRWGAWQESSHSAWAQAQWLPAWVKQTFAMPGGQAQNVACGQVSALPGDSRTAWAGLSSVYSVFTVHRGGEGGAPGGPPLRGLCGPGIPVLFSWLCEAGV